MSEDKQTKEINDVLMYSTQQFDKHILLIASGALGGSFAFIKGIVPDLKVAHEKWCLIASWYIFAGVIFISLIGHFGSMLAGSWALKYKELEPEIFNKKVNRWNLFIDLCNLLSIVLILLGAIFLIAFIDKNI